MIFTPPEAVIIGEIKQDYIITDQKRALNNRLGGSAIACASGSGLWNQQSLIVSAVDQNFPDELFQQLDKNLFSLNGISTSSKEIDHRRFSYFKSASQVFHSEPAKHYLDLKLEFPKELLGYHQHFKKSKEPLFSRFNIPEDINSVSIAHICPLSFIDHIRIPFLLREKGVSTITLQPHTSYLKQLNLNEIPQLISNLTTFIPTQDQLFNLYPLLRFDIWALLSQFENKGCQFIVVPDMQGDTLLYDLESKRKFSIPAYPIRIKNLLGIEDVFSGGFIAGYQKTLDPIEGVLHGLISASFAMAGYTATYALDTLPSLAKARLDILREEIRRV